MSRGKPKPSAPSRDLESPKNPWGRTEILVLSLILATAFAMHWPFRQVTYIRDEGEYAYIGQEILRGAVPYRDVYNQKTPFVFFFFAGVQGLFGPGVTALRIATTVYGLATTVVLYALARMLFGRPAAVGTVVAFVMMTFDQCGILHQSSTEFFMLLWMSLGLLFWYLGWEKGKSWMILCAGVAAGLCYLTKQTGAVLLIFFLVDGLWIRIRKQGAAESWPLVFGRIVLAIGGFALAQAGVIAYFAWHQAVPAYLECTWWNNFSYIGNRHKDLAKVVEDLTQLVNHVAQHDMGLWLCGTTGLVALAWFRGHLRGSGLVILLLGTASAGFLTGSRYVHYYEPMIVPLSLGNGLAWAWLWQRATLPGCGIPGRLLLGLLAVIPLLIGIEDRPRQGFFSDFLHGPALNIFTSLSQSNQDVMSDVLPHFAAAPRAAQYVQEHTQPGERILVVGSEPEIYYFSERPSCTRLVITYPLTGPYPYAEGLRKEFLKDFKECRPRYVIDCQDPHSYTEWGPEAVRFTNLIDPILETEYKLEKRILDEKAKEAKVVAVRGNAVLLNIASSRNKGVLSLQQFPEGAPAVGSNVDVHIEGYDRASGLNLLSRANPWYLVLRRNGS
jgi:hypothetical protein